MRSSKRAHWVQGVRMRAPLVSLPFRIQREERLAAACFVTAVSPLVP
jgi:hypothetical protein